MIADHSFSFGHVEIYSSRLYGQYLNVDGCSNQSLAAVMLRATPSEAEFSSDCSHTSSLVEKHKNNSSLFVISFPAALVCLLLFFVVVVVVVLGGGGRRCCWR